jgi:hypothetical protein
MEALFSFIRLKGFLLFESSHIQWKITDNHLDLGWLLKREECFIKNLITDLAGYLLPCDNSLREIKSISKYRGLSNFWEIIFPSSLFYKALSRWTAGILKSLNSDLEVVMKYTFLIVSVVASTLSFSSTFAIEQDPFGSFCKDTHQTFSQCKAQAEEAYKACEKAVEEDSLNMVSDKYSMKYCQNTLKSLLQWCQENCKH